MSAPDTNTETQVTRHKPAFLGICAALALAALGAFGFSLLSVPASEQATPVPTEVPASE